MYHQGIIRARAPLVVNHKLQSAHTWDVLPKHTIGSLFNLSSIARAARRSLPSHPLSGMRDLLTTVGREL